MTAVFGAEEVCTMRFVFPRTLLPVFLLFFASAAVADAVPEDAAAARSLLISPSVRVNGMGGAGVTLTDEASGYYNPAALAFTARKWDMTATFYPGSMDWRESSLDSAATYSYCSFSIGGEQRLLRQKRGRLLVPLVVGGALGYYHTARDRGNLEGTDAANPLETYTVHPVESVHAFVFSGSARFVAEVGAGATVKRVYSDFTDTTKADATAFDLGLLGKLPLVSFTEYLLGKRVEFLGLRPELDVSGGVTWNNLGGKFAWSDSSHDPLPRNFTGGYSGSAGLTARGMGNLNFVRLTVVRETYVPKIDGDSFPSDCRDKKRGWEFSFCETVVLREGQFDDNDGGVHYKTRGMSISSDGIFKVISSRRPVKSRKNYLDYAVNHLSLNWSAFEYTQSPVYDMSHSQFTVLFRM